MTSDIQPKISLVIPAYNEEDYLSKLLDTVQVARHSYRGGADAIEVIVANNASTDRTAEIAESYGARVVFVERRVIAAARNGGAETARGSILCFIDADSKIHPETFNAIEDCLSRGRVVAGTTGIRPDSWSLGLLVTFCLVVPLAILSRLDAGVVFCLREDFEQIGGYNEDRLYAEDIEFLVTMRRLGRHRKQKLVRITSVKATTSSRKWDRYGQWHSLTQMLRLGVLALRSPGADDKFARKYWYEDR